LRADDALAFTEAHAVAEKSKIVGKLPDDQAVHAAVQYDGL
jgi:hypothetical protein